MIILTSKYEALNVLILLLSIFYSTNANVLQLTAQNFEAETSKYELVVLNFYADWCRFSQILAPVFEEAYMKILNEFANSNQVMFGKIDCESETNLAQRFRITKYPTLKLMKNGKVMKREYRGQRSVDGISKHVRDLLKDPVNAIDNIESFKKIDESKSAILGYFSVPPAGAPSEYNIFRKVASDLKDDCNFYWMSGESFNSHNFPGRQNFIVFKSPRSKPGENDLLYPGVLSSYDELSSWATGKCIPLVREITFENAEELTEEGLPFLILFHMLDDKKSIELYTKVVTNELQSESSSINFLLADGKKFAHPLHHLGKETKDLPLIAIDSFRHMYLFDNFKDIEIPGKLKQFVLDLHSGKLHREFHFGPDPTTNLIQDPGQTSPPESTFRKLAPSSNRYTLLRDEL